MSDRIVHIVDDDQLFRASVAVMLESNGYVAVEHADGHSFANHVDSGAVGCALIDLAMPGLDGLALQDLINAKGAAVPVVIMTGLADVATAVRAMKAGAVDFIEKPFEMSALLAAVAAAHQRVARQDAPELAAFRERLTTLTGREREILASVISGRPTKIIAYELGISPRTVDAHRIRIAEKLQVSGLSNLIRLGLAANVANGA